MVLIFFNPTTTVTLMAKRLQRVADFAANRQLWTEKAAYLSQMPLQWNYNELPIKLKHLLVVSILILLAFWAQGDFHFQVHYSIFLLCNYLVWFLLLPVIYQGVKDMATKKSVGTSFNRRNCQAE